MKEALKILMLEDSMIDAELIQQFLLKEKPQCEFKLVMTQEDYLEALDTFQPDLILSDNTLPQFDAKAALDLFNQRSLHMPFILVTGTVSEEFAAGIIKLGADDYILKDRLARLPGAIDAALKKKRTESEVRHSEEVRMLIMNSALDAIICIDTDGLITVWNLQAERMFGWKEEEVINLPLVELIIPEQYREAHKRGLRHYLETREGPVLNKVIEIAALNKAGIEFPVELAIVPIRQGVGDFFCAFIRDISERKKAEESLKAMEKEILNQKVQEQKKITRAVIKAQESQRNHIGQELHDNVCQILVGTKISLTRAGSKDEKLKELIRQPLELLETSISEIRSLSSDAVTPLRNIDLKDLVEALLVKIGKDTGLKAIFSCIMPAVPISDDIKLNIYRIIQEQLNNIIKHAEAKEVRVMLKDMQDRIEVTVQDDGKGFDIKQKREGIGISNMINRIEAFNGKIKIESTIGKGSKIQISIPYTQSGQPSAGSDT